VKPSHGVFNIQVDGAIRAADAGDGASTGPLILDPGTHTVGVTAGTGTNAQEYSSVFGGDCAPDGRVVLSSEENKVCLVTNTQSRRDACLQNCDDARDACMEGVGTPGGPLGKQCAMAFAACRNNCH
jgi:hypothetical protein